MPQFKLDNGTDTVIDLNFDNMTKDEILNALQNHADPQALIAQLMDQQFIQDNDDLFEELQIQANAGSTDPSAIVVPTADLYEAIAAHIGYVETIDEDDTPSVDDAATFIDDINKEKRPAIARVHARCTSIRPDKNGNVNVVMLSDNGSPLETTLYPNYFTPKVLKRLFEGEEFGTPEVVGGKKLPVLQTGKMIYFEIDCNVNIGLNKAPKLATTYRTYKPKDQADRTANPTKAARWDKTEKLLKELFPSDWQNYIHNDPRLGKFIVRFHKKSNHENVGRFHVRSTQELFEEQYNDYLQDRREQNRLRKQMELINEFQANVKQSVEHTDDMTAFKMAANIALGKGFNM